MLIFGKILLILLGVIVALIFLVLFFPIGYSVYLKRAPQDMTVKVRASWLLGLLRICYNYPEAAEFKLKLAFFTLYRSSKNKKKETGKDKKGISDKKRMAKEKRESKKRQKQEKAQKLKKRKKENSKNEKLKNKKYGFETETQTFDGGQETAGGKTADSGPTADGGQTGASGNTQETKTPEENLTKPEKIKYTIQKIYDKIKETSENAEYYKEMLQRKETKELLGYAGMRVGRILKQLKPKHLKGELIIGTGSPDTTGYLMAGYGIVSPWLSLPENIRFTMDFERAVLEGQISAKGFITIFGILSNGVLLLLDKRIKKIYNEYTAHCAEHKKK